MVPASAAVYWAGVSLRALQIKRRTGRLPDVRPRSVKEKALWAGWALVVAGWAASPFWGVQSSLESPTAQAAGLGAILLGLAGTVWCHASMGDAWRVSIGGPQKTPLITCGPYSRLRHPLYFFQIVILAGVFLLAPSPLSLAVLILHRLLVGVKMADEERHLEEVHGSLYKEYRARTGALWPRV